MFQRQMLSGIWEVAMRLPEVFGQWQKLSFERDVIHIYTATRLKGASVK